MVFFLFFFFIFTLPCVGFVRFAEISIASVLFAGAGAGAGANAGFTLIWVALLWLVCFALLLVAVMIWYGMVC